MPWIFNPFTGNLNYYEIGVPEDGEPGEIVRISSDGTTVEWAEPTTIIGNTIVSNPIEDCLRVTNIYVDSGTGKTVVEYEDVPSSEAGTIISNPPTGHYKVLNIYVNPSTNRTVVDYEDTPQP